MYNPDYYNWNTQTGWRCPVCGKIWAPHVSSCYYCNAERKTFTTTETIKIDDAEWWENFVKNTSANININISKNETISWNSPVSEDDQSWRDWLDEMRANNRRNEILKDE